MNISDLIKYFKNHNLFNEIKKQISSLGYGNQPIYISPLYGASKSFLIDEVAAYKNQILVLVSDEKLANELYVELDFLNFGWKKILINDVKSEPLQEKLTEISNNKSFILISTYQILKQKLPDKKEIANKTTQIQVGGNLSYNDLTEYLVVRRAGR